jgi:rhodanese-related sulfurtransferase
VDVRKSSNFERQHLPKAVSIPLQSFPERYVEIPRDIPVVLY